MVENTRSSKEIRRLQDGEDDVEVMPFVVMKIRNGSKRWGERIPGMSKCIQQLSRFPLPWYQQPVVMSL